jgi:hypothetical protein
MEQQEQILFSLPLKKLEPIFKNWLRDVLTENNISEKNNHENQNPELITRDELKKITGLNSDATVIKYERLDIFRPMRLGRKIFYDRSQVLEAIKEFRRV